MFRSILIVLALVIMILSLNAQTITNLSTDTNTQLPPLDYLAIQNSPEFQAQLAKYMTADGSSTANIGFLVVADTPNLTLA